MHTDFRDSERDTAPRLTCCDCGKPAQGNVACEDGELCDACGALECVLSCGTYCEAYVPSDEIGT